MECRKGESVTLRGRVHLSLYGCIFRELHLTLLSKKPAGNKALPWSRDCRKVEVPARNIAGRESYR